MKTLLIYNSAGSILFTKAPVEDNEVFKCLIYDVPEGRQPISVINDAVVLEDTEEVKLAKQKLKEIEREALRIKQSLLDMEDDL